MKIKFGFIGCGNMGGALAQAVAKTASGQFCFSVNKQLPRSDAKACGRQRTVTFNSSLIFASITGSSDQ